MAACSIVSVGKRRDGGTRYWCLHHRADATAKYGKRAKQCRYAHIPDVSASETAEIDIYKYKGGVGIWGAVPPIYDTTTLGVDRGIHVHARLKPGEEKLIDDTYRRVVVRGASEAFDVNELDAIYFMVSMIFGKRPEEVTCSRCNSPHLDKDWFSVHPHKSHLCASCGKTFRDDKIAVGNPAAVAARLESERRAPEPSRRTLKLRQADYEGGIRIWGSNQAILWTAPKAELTGIHVHAYRSSGAAAEIDDTFAAVTVDDVVLDSDAVRTYMAQMALPHIAERVVFARCSKCKHQAFDSGDAAFTPEVGRTCTKCKGELEVAGRFRKVISNPLVGTIARLAEGAVRIPQRHDLGLIPETL